MLFLEVCHLSKRFGKRTALNNLSMNLFENEIIGVIGTNGAGKTTLFKSILGIYSPDEGSIHFHDSVFDLKNDVGYLPEQRGLFPKTSVYSQLIAFGYLKAKRKEDIKQRIDEWLEFFEIEQFRHEILANLSKGNQQKVQFISAVVHHPALLILDEPFSGLDPINTEKFIKAIEWMKNNGSTIIYASHKLDSIEHLSDRLLFLKEGEKVYLDTIHNIQNYYGLTLKIKNKTLTEELLTKFGYAFQKNNDVYEVSINNREEAAHISQLLPDKFSELFSIEQKSIEEIYKTIHLERRLTHEK